MPPSTPYDVTGIEYYTIPSFSFVSGTTLHDLKVAYVSSPIFLLIYRQMLGGMIRVMVDFLAPVEA